MTPGTLIRGAGGQLLAPALLCALLSLTGAQEHTPAESTSFPLEATGEIHFTADAALMLDPAGEPEVYFTFALPPTEVACAEREGVAGDWMSLDLQMGSFDAGERLLLRQGLPLVVRCRAPTENEAMRRRLLYLQAPLQPGVSQIEIALEDKNTARTGLIPVLRGEKQRGIVRGGVPAADLRSGRGLSSPLFLWAMPERNRLYRVDGFHLGPADSLRGLLEPNPGRGYGLYKGAVHLYVEAYGLAASEGELSVQLASPGGGRPHLRQTTSLELPWERTGIIAELDISALPAGSYPVELEFYPWGETADPFRVRAAIDVLWDSISWSKTQAALIEEMAVLLPEEQLGRYRQLRPGEREAFVESLWVGLGDAAPTGGAGPRQALFRERIETADARYGSPGLRGALSDRGRVYIRYGQPDEITKELSPQREDQIYHYLEREIDENEAAEAAGGVPQRHWLDNAAYEVWSYVGLGDPLVPDWDSPSRGRTLQFIFVDELGTGNYRLIYSNVFGGF